MILQGVLIILSPFYALQPSFFPLNHRSSSILLTATTIHSDLVVMNLFTVFQCRLLEQRKNCYCCYLWDGSHVVTQCPMGKLMYFFVRVDNIANYYSRLNPHKNASVLLHFQVIKAILSLFSGLRQSKCRRL